MRRILGVFEGFPWLFLVGAKRGGGTTYEGKLGHEFLEIIV